MAAAAPSAAEALPEVILRRSHNGRPQRLAIDANARSDSEEELPVLRRTPRSRDARSRALEDAEEDCDSSDLEGESPQGDPSDVFEVVSRDDVSHC